MKIKANSRAFKKVRRNESLEQQIQKEQIVIPKRKRKATEQVQDDEEEEFSHEQMDDKLSKKILVQAHGQRKELENEVDTASSISNKSFKLRKTSTEVESDDEEEHWSEDDEYNEETIEEEQISPEDEAILAQFEGSKNQVTLSDLIMSKLESKEKPTASMNEDRKAAIITSNINPKVAEVYGKVGTLLSRYKSGKLPKAFKVVPSLQNWEEILYLMKPEEWTCNAMYQATRLFASNLNAKLAQKFYRYVLLDRVRRDIKDNKKLNFHLYMSLKKCIYKPAAFFKGILLPLVQDGCTLKEAAIVGSVVVKNSIPVLHSAAAILKLIEQEYSGAQSLLLKYFMDKKYALPFKVVDALVEYFAKFQKDVREFPVLWHQSLLLFAQRYKEDLSKEQKDVILHLIKVKVHEDISPEIQRELESSKCRDSADVEMKL